MLTKNLPEDDDTLGAGHQTSTVLYSHSRISHTNPSYKLEKSVHTKHKLLTEVKHEMNGRPKEPHYNSQYAVPLLLNHFLKLNFKNQSTFMAT